MTTPVLTAKIVNRAWRCAYKNSALYNVAAAHAVRRAMAFPLHDDAVATLQAASPRPVGGLNVAARNWPNEPLVEVSVIVPCYNVERFVETCVNSITSQETTHSFEVVCIDDGSTDATGSILDTIATAEAPVRVVHQSNRGFSGARNAGIAEARGASLMFVDSDDLMLPGAIETLCNAYAEGGCDYVTASYKDLSEDGQTITPLAGKRNHGAPWGRLYSRGIWRDLEFPEGFWFEDTVQGFCINTRWRERYIDVPVYLYRHNSKGITSTCNSSKKGLDTLWIVDELLRWNRQLGNPFDQTMYERVIYQLGPILWGRTVALDEREHIAAFAYSCDLLAACDPEGRYATERGPRWSDLERGLRTRNYALWKTAIYGLG